MKPIKLLDKVKQSIIAQKKTCKRVVSSLLTITMLATSMELGPLALHAEKIDGMDISIQWSNGNSADQYIWDANSSETKNVKLQFNYKFNDAKKSTKDFDIGDIRIEIPGIGKVNRTEIIEASINQSAMWKVESWDPANDIYTIINKQVINKETAYAGSFSLSWELESRETVTNSHKDIQASMTVKTYKNVPIEGSEDSDGNPQYEEVVEYKRGTTNTIHFDFTSVTDEFKISASADGFNSPEGLENLLSVDEIDSGKTPEDFWWVKLTVNSGEYKRARGTKNLRYKVEFPDGGVLRKISSGTFRDLGTESGGLYELDYSPSVTLWITYPKTNDEHDLEERNHHFELWGIYLDTKEDRVLDETDIPIRPSDYDFRYLGTTIEGYRIYKDGDNSSGESSKLKSDLYDDIILPYDISAIARYYKPVEKTRRAARRRVATPSNYIEEDEESGLKFEEPNYLDSLSVDELNDKDSFREAVLEAQQMYKDALENYESDLEDYKEQKRLEMEEKELEDELNEDVDLIDDVTVKEPLENSEEKETLEEKEEVSNSQVETPKNQEEDEKEKESESIKETLTDDENESIKESDSIDEKEIVDEKTPTSEKESLTEDKTNDTKIEEDTKEDVKENVDVQDTKEEEPKLEISKKEVNLVQASLATPPNATKQEEIEEDTIIGDDSINVASLDSGLGDMDVYILDDYLEITDSDGFRVLNNDEYEMVSIKIPSRTSFINANGFPIKADKYTVEIYSGQYPNGDLIASTKIGNQSKTIKFKEQVNQVYLKICDVGESLYIDNITLRVKFHLNENSTLLDNGRVRNLDALIAMQNGECLNIPDDGSYIGPDQERVRDRDKEVYGQNVQRALFDYYYKADTVYNRVIVNTLKDKKEVPVIFRQEEDGYKGEILFTSILVDSKDVKGWEVYSLLPLGVEVDYSQLDKVATSNNIKTSEGETLSNIPREYFDIEVIENYRNGRTLVKGVYDFGDKTVSTRDGSAAFKLPVKLSFENYMEYGGNFTIHAEQFINCPGKNILASDEALSGKDNGRAFYDGDEWADINGNGNEEEFLTHHFGYLRLNDLSNQHIEIRKYIKSPRTFNSYTTNIELGDGTSREDIWASFGCEYSYKLNVLNRGTPVKDLVLYDFLEQGYYLKTEGGDLGDRVSSKWQGKVIGVDTSYLNSLGYNPIVYYTSNENAVKDINNSDWSNVKPSDVKGIAVAFDKAPILDKDLYIEIKMQAPNDMGTIIKGDEAVNDFYINYIDSNDESVNLESNAVELKIDVPKGLVIINKTDKEGRKLSGWEFTIYRDSTSVGVINAKGMFEADGKTEHSGLEVGNYKLKETKVPFGYETKADETLIISEADIESGIKTLNIINERKLGKVSLVKKDSRSGEKLIGAEFELYKKNDKADYEKLGGVYVTDEQGKIEINNLDWGDYYLKEVKAPEGYYMTDSSDIDFKIDKNNLSIEKEVLNSKWASVRLIKKDADDMDKVVSGATYGLYTSDGVHITSEVTDKDGKILIESVRAGNYYFLEEEAAPGYELNDKKINFTVSRNSQAVVEVSTTDKEKLTSIRIIKKDSDSGEKLENAFFELEKQIGENWARVGVYRTDSLGEIDIYGLKFGNYRLHETSAPQGYVLDNTPFEFEINETKEYVGKVLLFERGNTRKTGNVSILKTDKDGAKIEGAHFKITKENGEVVEEVVSDELGVARTSKALDFGAYKVIEVEPVPKGYKLNEKVEEFEINSDTVDEVIELKFINERVLGNVKLTKYNEGKTEKLSGAKYGLYKNDGTFIKDGISDNKGEILFENLDWGSYYLQELVAPNGYSISNDKIRFVVNNDNCTVLQELEAEDKMGTVSIIIRKQLENGELDLYEPFGNPTFTFRISGFDASGEYHEWYRQITLSKENLSGMTVLADIPESNLDPEFKKGETYIPVGYLIEEVNASRYTQVSVNQTDNAKSEVYLTGDDVIKTLQEYGFVFDDNGVPLSVKTCLGRNAALNYEFREADVTFSNTIEKWDKYSDTSNAINMVNKDRKLVSLGATIDNRDITDLFNGGSVLDTSILKDHLTVSAYYDSPDENGDVSKVLDNSDYTITPNSLEGIGELKDYLITINYGSKKVSLTVQANAEKAGWTLNIYNGEEIIKTYANNTFGSSVAMSIEGVIPTGYELEGYYLDKELTQKYDGNTYMNSDETVSVVNLYAKIIEKTYTITYIGYDKTGKYKVKSEFSNEMPTSYKPGELTELTLVDPIGSSNGWEFIGWTEGLNSSGSVGSVTDENTLIHDKMSMTGKSGNLVLVARYKEVGATLMNTYNFRKEVTKAFGSSIGDSITDFDVVFNSGKPSGTCVQIDDKSRKDYTAYATIENGVFTIYTSGHNLFLNPDSNNFFGYKWGGSSFSSEGVSVKIVADQTILYNLKNISGLNKLNTSKVVNMTAMFQKSEVEELDLSNFDTSNVTNMSFMFYTADVINIDLSSFDTSNVTDMTGMFYDSGYYANKTESVVFGDKFDTSKVTKMALMFYQSSIRELDLSRFNTSNVTDMQGMFCRMYEIKSLDLTNFDTSSATNMSYMFSDAGELNSLRIDSFDTSKVTNMAKMFYRCRSLTKLDLTSFDTSNVTDMNYMFYNAYMLSGALDLRSFNTSNVTNMSYMFAGCDHLTLVDVTQNYWIEPSNKTNMFGETDGWSGSMKIKSVTYH